MNAKVALIAVVLVAIVIFGLTWILMSQIKSEDTKDMSEEELSCVEAFKLHYNTKTVDTATVLVVFNNPTDEKTAREIFASHGIDFKYHYPAINGAAAFVLKGNEYTMACQLIDDSRIKNAVADINFKDVKTFYAAPQGSA